MVRRGFKCRLDSTVEAPRFQCPDRTQGCHGRCEKYLAFAEKRRKYVKMKNMKKARYIG